MATKSNSKSKSTKRQLPSHDLLSWEEAAAYLGPSFTKRWLQRQVYMFKTIKSVPVGGAPNGKPGRRMIPRAELDRFVLESMTGEGE